MYNFEITFREVIISLTIIGLGIAAIISINGAIDNSYVGKNDKYMTAAIYNDQNEFDYGLNGGTGYAFIEGDVEPVGSVSMSELKGEYVYIKRYKETYDYVMKYRTETYKCGKNTCTRRVPYWTWEWRSKGSVTEHIDEFTINGYIINWDEISTPWDHRLDLEGMLESSTIDGKSGFKVKSFGDYFQSNEGTNTRYKYYVITKEDVKDGAIFVNFENSEMDAGEGKYRVYDMTPEELSVDIMKSPLGWKIFVSVLGGLIIGGLVFGFYYLDNNWLHSKKKKEEENRYGY